MSAIVGSSAGVINKMHKIKKNNKRGVRGAAAPDRGKAANCFLFLRLLEDCACLVKGDIWFHFCHHLHVTKEVIPELSELLQASRLGSWVFLADRLGVSCMAEKGIRCFCKERVSRLVSQSSKTPSGVLPEYILTLL